ncbi:hypothetical protein NZD85_00850 [Empedobacter stercoris]|uniref:Uncharacterized protein n=2 Tax=Empedobacter TaxID=59734 RepID=A0ABY8VAU8_9FLAO|nr:MULTISPECIES: hypothetical protein [Empedobacter]MCA4809791.1 hypothetical protein [Empedobacter stercoris]MDM1523584.1 hypothetical protein [Empedobacter sp. 225-1]MDM1543525.1 hypothetical protein [Empedobacter sp. 189-2]NOJ74856.1 hypothetical protein [Empedobacter stercoris]QNT13918.1 hypothetical protein HNV03_04190 [Empedobacter stercoris]
MHIYKLEITQTEHEFLSLIHEFIFGSATAHLLIDPPFIIQSIDKISQKTNCTQKKEFLNQLIAEYKINALEYVNQNNISDEGTLFTKNMLIRFYSKFSYYKVQKEQELIRIIHNEFLEI